MILAVTSTTWVQLGGVAVALLATLAAWAGVKQARDAAREVRDSEREARLPLLLLSQASVGSSHRPSTLALSIYNAGDVAVDVAVILVGEGAYARGPVGVVRPGETVNFGSDIAGTDRSRAVAFGRSRDGTRWVWDRDRNRRELAGDHAADPTWEAIFGTFYPGEDLGPLRLGSLLRGEGTYF